MSTMSDLHIRTQDELDYLAEVDHHNQAWMREHPSAVESQPIWLLQLRGGVADALHRLAYKIDYCPF